MSISNSWFPSHDLVIYDNHRDKGRKIIAEDKGVRT